MSVEQKARELAREIVRQDFRDRGFSEADIAFYVRDDVGEGEDRIPYAPAHAMLRVATAALLRSSTDDAKEIERKWRDGIQACLDNIEAHAKEVGLHPKEVEGREYAWVYALASLDDIQESHPLQPRSSAGRDEALEEAANRLFALIGFCRDEWKPETVKALQRFGDDLRNLNHPAPEASDATG